MTRYFFLYSGVDEQEIENSVNRDLKTYYDWLCYNKMGINVGKTVHMIYNQKRKLNINPEIKLNNIALKRVEEYRYLGLIMSSKLNWESHVHSVVNKIVLFIGAIRRCSHQLNTSTRYMLYHSFIEPHLRYLIPCWGNTTVKLFEQMQRVQNKAVKTIFSLSVYTPTDILYQRCNLMKLSKLKILEQVKLIYKIKHKTIKTNLEIKQNNEFHSHNTRHKENLKNNSARTKKTQDSPIYRSVQVYNTMPKNLLQGEEQNFKNLKKYLKLRE